VIRKVILLIVLGFSIFWFAIGYGLKHFVASKLQEVNSDNFKISYTNLNLSGFPKFWKINVNDIKITTINNIYSHEFIAKKLHLNPNWTFQSFDIEIEGDIGYHQSGALNRKYYLDFDRTNSKMSINFDDIIFTSGIGKNFANILIKDITLSDIENKATIIATINLDVSIEKKQLELKYLDIKFNENMKAFFSGNIYLSHPPVGKISIELTNAAMIFEKFELNRFYNMPDFLRFDNQQNQVMKFVISFNKDNIQIETPN
jgi:hypothetical protein